MGITIKKAVYKLMINKIMFMLKIILFIKNETKSILIIWAND